MPFKHRQASTAHHLHTTEAESFRLDEEIVPEPSPEPKPVSKTPSYETDRIGDILRRVREHRKEDLETISDYLRIRLNYLVALENNRYEDLPADAYVIGFLRTYALYLGLDGKGAIDHYRREMAGRRRKPSLTMPQPMAEGRAPTIAVLVSAAAAVLVIFFAWYGLSSPDVIPTPAEAQTNSTEEQVATSPSLTVQTATSDGIALTVPVTAVATSQGELDIKDSDKAADALVTTIEARQPSAETQRVDINKEQANEIKSVFQKPEGASKDKIDVEPIPPLPLLPQEQIKTETAGIYGEKNTGRVSIKSDKESWIMITDSKGVTVFERTLKPGESYNVPSTKGLKLTTSNPSGIVFQLDGAALPKIKSTAEIARAIPLEPDRLKNRINEAETPSTE